MGTPASRSRIIKCATTVERQYGGDDVGMQNINAAIDGFFLFEKGDPISMEVETVDNQPLRGAFTRAKQTVSYRMYKWAAKLYFNRNPANTIAETAGDPYDAGSYSDLATKRPEDRRWGPLWRACGLNPTYTSGSAPHKVVFKPTSDASLQRSCRIVTELDGVYFDAIGCRGNFTINGTAGQPLEVNFDMMGKPGTKNGAIVDPTSAIADLEGITNWGTWTGGSTDNPLFQCANGQIAVNGGDTLVAADFVLKSFTFDKGNDIQPRTDANDCESVREYSIADAQSTLELVIEMSQDLEDWINDNDALNPWKDWRTMNTHAVSFSHGRATGDEEGEGPVSANAQVDFLFPQCQITNVTTSDGDGGIRNVTISYNVIHETTDDGEFTFTWWGDNQ